MGQYGIPMIPNHYFSHACAECQLLFESRNYFACIAQCQTVAEALARFIYERGTGLRPSGDFKTNIDRIKGAHVQPDVSNLLDDLYGDERQRHDFHHLNKPVPTKYEELQSIATNKIDLLKKIEYQVFDYEMTGNGLKFKYPKYWENTIGTDNAFLKFSP
jgi:hypothetical protein